MAGEQQRRALLPFLKRAEEMERADALVAYYCRMRAAEEGLALDDRAPETMEVLGELEAAKEGLELEHEADRMHCEGFAMSIFEKADRADRAGAASLGTAKAFYASSVFMEVCRQFGELDADLEAKQKYAVWKASDIRKALKRGERPAPGPPGGEAAAAQEAAPGPPEGPGPAGGLEAEKPGVGEHQLRGAGEEPFPAPPSARAAAPEQRSDPAEALEVDELGLPKAPLQGAPLSPSVGIDVEQFTLPTMPRAADESAASYGPQGGQNAAPGEMEDPSRAVVGHRAGSCTSSGRRAGFRAPGAARAMPRPQAQPQRRDGGPEECEVRRELARVRRHPGRRGLPGEGPRAPDRGPPRLTSRLTPAGGRPRARPTAGPPPAGPRALRGAAPPAA